MITVCFVSNLHNIYAGYVWHVIDCSQEADENGSDGLDIDEFKAAFGQILGKGKNEQQMAIMFMKIDTNCDGTVDWVRNKVNT